MFPEFESDKAIFTKNEILEKIKKIREEIPVLLSQKERTYENVIRPLDDLVQEMQVEFTVLAHLNSVKNSKEIQAYYTEILPEITAFYSDLGQNEELNSVYQEILKNEENTLSIPRKKSLQDSILQFRLSGIGLKPKIKKRIQEIQIRLSDLNNQFSQNLLDATNTFELILDRQEDVEGIPESDLNASKTEDGKYRFTLQAPSYTAYMTHGPNRNIRESLYKAYTTRAPQNGKLISEILSLRNELAKFLDYFSYAELSLATKVANSVPAVLKFLRDLAKQVKPVAEKEFKDLSDFAKTLGIDSIQAYDTAFVSEKMMKSKFDFDEEETRPYFEKDSVISGTFQFLNMLFGIEFRKTSAKVWEDKVQVYDLYKEKKLISRLYLDLEARKDKQGGAWMHNWHSRNRMKGREVLPTAFVVCNFPVSTKDSPSLLKHSDVVTFFHEMGHALHHLCTKIEEPPVSGINGVEWDAVEFPSQFLENFATEADVLKIFGKHYKTGETIPDSMIVKLKETKNFLSAMGIVRQLEFSLFDIFIHLKSHTEEEVHSILNDIRKEVSVVIPPEYNRFQNGFSHIFSGGYAAGYYSYKWAEVMSADAFFAFVERGIFDSKLSEVYFREILEKGGSENAMVLFKRFLGREPRIESLLKLYGLKEAA
ncbi:M3 family metallopeptidase [Leptospira kirschneri]|uniref:M3 family metallopeptidase n=1 Tax=Leptospira kirschneri TaxID=29507 RepID=UPI0002785B9D|nr:M3 family metallopeptidase [Leptospira kirschneri]EJO70527.1 peptidase family M3 [Leptospira kirschneri serovar Grippotyphosa str. RM52]EKR07017.1 peptidase family M3 [Leptospira kirschneri serovar Valbuzzi str. 200702274]EMK05745.1 peptidase family M3 [Leptospira kirschneri str. MMD1493]EMK16947.1 peptidase family M3 [Leptospira kirschneri serovar Bim str. PUO 1247]EMN04080.1 peptidase family M3 [Leptospira kirschneri serovar Bim str. 1051]